MPVTIDTIISTMTGAIADAERITTDAIPRWPPPRTRRTSAEPPGCGTASTPTTSRALRQGLRSLEREVKSAIANLSAADMEANEARLMALSDRFDALAGISFIDLWCLG